MDYKYELSGVESLYFTILLDRQVSNGYVTRGGICGEKTSTSEMSLLNAIANDRCAIKSNWTNRYESLAELIALDGNKITIKTTIVDKSKAAVNMNRLIKRIQRKIAPNESLRRIK